MMIMPANNSSGIVQYFAGKYPNKVGYLNTPHSWKRPPYYMPYALDNGCFTKWDELKFYEMLKKTKLLPHPPLWVVVPDIVGDFEGTLRMWHEHHKKIDFPLAFACQDGCEPSDVPREAICCFIGGSTEWKLNTAHKFKGCRELLHIGRVSTESRMKWAERIGADSIDGTGFFRARGRQYMAFIEYFEGERQLTLWK